MSDLNNAVPLSKLIAPSQEQAQVTWSAVVLVVVLGLFGWAFLGFGFLGVLSLVLGKW